MIETDDHLASANAFIRHAFAVTPWTKMTEIGHLYPNLKTCEGYWSSWVHQGLPSDRLLVAVRMRKGRITRWVTYIRCTNPRSFSSTQASIASQLNHKLGKAEERWDGEGARHRTFYPNPAEVARYYRCSGSEWGEGIVMILSRNFKQPAEAFWQPPGLDDLTI